MSSALIALLIVAGVYLAVVAVLAVIGRRSAARAVAGFIPDCAIMFRRLLARPETSRWERTGLVVLVAYLLSPLDIVPDFIPVAGQLDDVVIVVLALAFVLRRHGEAAIRSAWPGPEGSLRVVLRAARTAVRPPGPRLPFKREHPRSGSGRYSGGDEGGRARQGRRASHAL